MIVSTLSAFGATSNVIWPFAVGVFTVFATAGIIMMGISLINRLIR